MPGCMTNWESLYQDGHDVAKTGPSSQAMIRKATGPTALGHYILDLINIEIANWVES